MKKTLITLLTLAGVTLGNSTILTFDKVDYSYDTDKWSLNESGNGPSNSWTSSTTLSDGTVATMQLDYGKFWDEKTATETWSNTSALNFMNQELGTSLTSADLTAINFDASAASNGKSTLTLNFADNSNYTTGDSIVFYLLVAERAVDNGTNTYKDFSVTGLNDATVYWANATETGGFFDANETAVTGSQGELLMIRVQGSLTSDQSVSFAANVQKNGWAMAAYNVGTANPEIPVVPEPATATLSLLALAGLAARRRRK